MERRKTGEIDQRESISNQSFSDAKAHKENVVANARFHSAIGPALIYVLDPNIFMPWQETQWFWKYHDGHTTYGPFYTQDECETHAKGCIEASGRNDEDNKNLIYVDFVGKQFLRDGQWTYTKKTLTMLKRNRYNPFGGGNGPVS